MAIRDDDFVFPDNTIAADPVAKRIAAIVDPKENPTGFMYALAFFSGWKEASRIQHEKTTRR